MQLPFTKRYHRPVVYQVVACTLLCCGVHGVLYLRNHVVICTCLGPQPRYSGWNIMHVGPKWTMYDDASYSTAPFTVL